MLEDTLHFPDHIPICNRSPVFAIADMADVPNEIDLDSSEHETVAGLPDNSPTSVWLGNSGFIFMHVACLGAFFTGVNVQDFALCGAVYLLQMVGVTVGYHRYLSHRSFKTSRVVQFVLAWLGCSAGQKGPLWWAAHHRHHHRTSDRPEDLHSPITHSIWQSHVGWVLSGESDDTEDLTVNDLSSFSELRWLDRYHWVAPLSLGILCLAAGGWSGLVW